jgi:hypothetical protein
MFDAVTLSILADHQTGDLTRPCHRPTTPLSWAKNDGRPRARVFSGMAGVILALVILMRSPVAG